ncbi:hypothetical protein SAMN05443999_109120 [Roseovarius azorensis]|uniref:Uncharacterized protein n=1 Tax=Roseovarius azorensis TaxID=1287727 RepID=A0A1H7U0F5_9RHOB|nr:hypothetical protein [Roseovarius azorensis]SEL90461.1 hypothetical protein SAMN05443999_109120 [Roseovarius azorensis]
MTRTALTDRPFASGQTRLDDVLRRFATPADRLVRKRGTLPDDPRSRLKALLREIDETVLPRRIELHVNGKRLAHLSVFNRRLASVEIAARSAPVPQGGIIASDFAERLAEIAATRGTLTCVTARQPDQQQPAEFTCSVGRLRAMLGFDAQLCEIDRLTEIMRPIAIARLSWTGEPAQRDFSGDKIWRPLLEDHARRFHSQAGGRKLDRLPRAGQAEGIAIPLSSEQLLMVACLADRGMAAILPHDAGLKAIVFWQTANSPEQESPE